MREITVLQPVDLQPWQAKEYMQGVWGVVDLQPWKAEE